MSIAIIGAGAFGTALAICYAKDGHDVLLVGRVADAMEALSISRVNPKLPAVSIPDTIKCTSNLSDVSGANTLLFAVPMQSLSKVAQNVKPYFNGDAVVACCKGLNLSTLTGPTSILSSVFNESHTALLTGPSFAADIAEGLPTALTLATKTGGKDLQNQLSTSSLRLYLTADTVGAEIGGALKNVVAIGAGIAIGAGLGDSARASLMTRGFGEMRLMAKTLGASEQTLNGLSGFGDLTLTCTSELSRNYRYGLSIGTGEIPDPSMTVEGVPTAKAVQGLAKSHEIELPVCDMVARICSGELTVREATKTLLSRPLKDEDLPASA